MIDKVPVAYVPFQELDQLGFWLNIIMTCPLGIFTYILFSPKFKISHVITTGILRTCLESFQEYSQEG